MKKLTLYLFDLCYHRLMNNEQDDAQIDVTPELEQKLQEVKDRCSPPARMHHKTFYILLFICSGIVFGSHSLVTDGMSWDAMRYSHGLLPLPVLMMRNAIIPAFLPVAVIVFFLLSFKFKSLRSPNFLAWFALVLFGMAAFYVWVSGMFAFHLLMAR
ncbi:MAG: hypothetical protein KKB51_07935 [Candidatus Riflebacteria bacterium]|nr:hypothetical protein [Candidatus Riflebacteria bacterium]